MFYVFSVLFSDAKLNCLLLLVQFGKYQLFFQEKSL